MPDVDGGGGVFGLAAEDGRVHRQPRFHREPLVRRLVVPQPGEMLGGWTGNGG